MLTSKISRRFVLIIMTVLFLSMAVNTLWTYRTQYRAIVDNLHVKAKLLAEEMMATWQFINTNQDLINTTGDGEYEFKGLHCAIVGKSIGVLFSQQSELAKLHFTNITTRNKMDAPDPFEKKALTTFRDNKKISEYYGVTDEQGETVFRYVGKMLVTESCLECHGEPKGTIDKTGYPREGWKVGEMAGAISMTISMEEDLDAFKETVLRNVLFMLGITVLIGGVVYAAIYHYVSTPLKALERSVQRIAEGDLEIRLDEKTLEDEFRSLGRDFNRMTGRLEELYRTLEDQVIARTKELGEANLSLQKQIRLKDDFMSMVSHELRTPLTAILAFVSLLKEDETRPDVIRRLNEVEANGLRLQTMVNNVLELARIEAGKIGLHCELVDINELVSEVESIIGPLAEEKNIAFETLVCGAEAPLLYCDVDKVYSMMENLCGNAVKFTETGGHILLTVDVSSEGTQIRVKDDGIGIREEALPTIFEKFVQADSSASRQYVGSGLGLALTKQMVDLHGGTIFVKSRWGEGSEFIIELPKNEGGKDHDKDHDCRR